jgi:penicillin-binding protein 1C
MKRALVLAVALATAAVAVLALATWVALEPVPESLPPGVVGDAVAFSDRHGVALNQTFATRWNLADQVPLHEVPELLAAAFIEAEDQRFFFHRGVDWRARLHALVENVRARRVVRGASTITEQAARLLTPRPRTLWARWLEGFEARRLERRFGKGEILEFYLNQVPYSRQRRGVAQAALDYFDRDLGTLHPREALALVVLVRSPSRFDLKRSTEAAQGRVDDLARRLEAKGALAPGAAERLQAARLTLRAAGPRVEAPHFVSHLKSLDPAKLRGGPRIASTLDGALQGRVTAMLEAQVARLAERNVGDGAALVIDHRKSEVLAWANAGGFSADVPGSQIDVVLTARQPGSALKPFLYALALGRGWTAATLLDDSPLARPVGQGLHQFRNYSRNHYGPVSLRQAMGNSLNIPAIRTAGALSPGTFLDFLHRLGFASLDRHPALYGEGLALGNGEVTLLELTSAYATLARGGERRAVRVLLRQPAGGAERVIDRDVSSIVADILADPEARRLEFGRDSVLALPVQTAVKTGTSNGYVDAWAFGFSDRFTVGVWLGNLDRREMDGVSGAVGPAYVLRSIFADLRRTHGERPLPMSPRLRRLEICRDSGQLAEAGCPRSRELFRPEHAPRVSCSLHSRGPAPAPALAVSEPAAAPAPALVDGSGVSLSQPTPGLLLAMDPRIPDDLEAFPFRVTAPRMDRIEWLVDGEVVARGGSDAAEYLWRLRPGRHTAQARVWQGSGRFAETEPVSFEVR